MILLVGLGLFFGIFYSKNPEPSLSKSIEPSLSQSIDPSLSQGLEGNWTIEGNSVYVNDINVYISATPHTISGSGYVYFNLTSKIYEGDIDVYWGFDNSKVKPTKAEIYKNSEWIDISNKFDSKDHEYEGMNKWYFLKDIPIVQNQSYLLRIYIKLKPNTQGSKYWFAIKPSALSITEAISTGHFYALDPWYEATNLVYDEIDDSSVNASLWSSASSYTYTPPTSTLTETNDYLTSYLSAQSKVSTRTGTRTLWTIGFPDISEVENVTVRVLLSVFVDRGSTENTCSGTSKLYLFNSLEKTIERGCGVSSGTTSDNSIWKVIRNNTCGINCFDIYNDDVFVQSINSTEAKIYTHNYITQNPTIISPSTVTSFSRLYYVYYARENNIILNSPVDDYISSTLSNVTLNCSATLYDGNNVTNISLWTNSTGTWILNQTNDTSSLNLSTISQTFNLSVNNDNSSLWSCQACETSGDCDFAEENRTLLFDIVYPQINLTSPTGTYPFPILGDDVDLNWSIDDLNLDSCWYEYDNANTTITCGDNHTTFNLVIDVYNLTMWANDSVGNTNSSLTTWNYSTTGFSETYNNETTEGNIETFSVNFLTDDQVSTGNLIYNGTSYPGSLSRTGSDPFNYTLQIDFTVPSVDTDTNMTFNWIILLSDSTQWNTSSHTQLVRNLGIDNCSTFTNIIFNYTLVSEKLQNKLSNTTIEIDLRILAFETSQEIVTFNHYYNNITK